MKAILATGSTYEVRQQLRAAGGVWLADHKGYACEYVKAESFMGAVGRLADQGVKLRLDVITLPDDALQPLTGDALRAHRQARLNRLAERLMSRAEAAERRAQAAHDKVSPHERDFLRLGEPVKRGHHSQRRHEKLIARADRAFEDQGRELSYAARLRSRAESMRNASVAGDAAARRQAARDAASAAIEVGDLVDSAIYGRGTVRMVSPKSFRVEFERGTRGRWVARVDKSLVTLLTKGGGEPAAAPRFKAGDPVTVRRLARTFPGTVRRLTPRGYSVEYEIAGHKSVDTFADGDVLAREVLA